MMTELMLVEGVSDVQLISYFLQNVYGWKYEKSNKLGIAPLDKYEHIESLSKDENQLILCGVGGNGKFAVNGKYFSINFGNYFSIITGILFSIFFNPPRITPWECCLLKW